jgi:hypothetical protein
MKINWAENPLETTVTMTADERENFRLKCIIEARTDRLASAHFALVEGQYFSLERARRYVSIYDKDGEIIEDDGGFSWMVNELQGGAHCGDCTCFPASCGKCQAEGILGIDTIEGLGKHSAHKIGGLYRSGKTLPDVIKALENYEPGQMDPNQAEAWKRVGGYEMHIPRWKAEAKAAHKWLVDYREQHFAGSD